MAECAAPGTVILLSGPSSAGKTTLARALQRLSAVPLAHLEADRAFPELPSGPPAEAWPEPPIVVFHRAAAVWARSGFGVVLDGSLPYGDDALRNACLDEFAGCDLRVVAVECAVDELERRTARRGDRVPGWSTRQARDIHAGLAPDARISTSGRPAGACAREMLVRLGLPVSGG